MKAFFQNLAGLFLIAIALHFTEKVPGTKHPYAQYPELGDHELELLPDWVLFGCHFMHIYQNLYDGVQGDKRGKYHSEFKWMSPYWRAWWWMSVRNPRNFYKRGIDCFDIKGCYTRFVAGQFELDEDTGLFGERLIYAIDSQTGQVYESFLWTARIGKRWLRWREGYKFKLNEEYADFGTLKLVHSYEGIKELTVQYARDGYHKGEADLALDRLAPAGNALLPTLKLIDN